MQALVDRVFARLEEKPEKTGERGIMHRRLLAARLTDKAGSSAIFDRGFVTYSNASKTELLDVPAEIIKEFGAVSPQTAQEMASGALRYSHADIALSITGIAGPDGGSPEKPVGLVYFGLATPDAPSQTFEYRFTGTRETIRTASVRAALELLIEELERPT